MSVRPAVAGYPTPFRLKAPSFFGSKELRSVFKKAVHILTGGRSSCVFAEKPCKVRDPRLEPDGSDARLSSSKRLPGQSCEESTACPSCCTFVIADATVAALAMALIIIIRKI